MTARKTIKTIAITLAATGAALGTTIAPAAFAASVEEVSVKLSLTELNSPTGLKKAYSELSAAAENYCTKGYDLRITSRHAESDCMTDLLDEFVKSVDFEDLTMYHAKVIN